MIFEKVGNKYLDPNFQDKKSKMKKRKNKKVKMIIQYLIKKIMKRRKKKEKDFVNLEYIHFIIYFIKN